ncbi:putative manganese transporter [Gaoshiqia sediminis]|uniref:Manganese transporter n=1 Tax=Gaoshiqia sediminis TaxID=2986998 RepID=A0AA42C7E6_9BACT|nr:putative manganese transporter [Gaoshiqia sediminis]MCW0484908.1 putative manganese transporter [Gaoshiqia sediminis]
MVDIFVPTFKQSLMITAFVLFMMVVIDYINVQSRNLWAEKLQQSPILQIILAAFLGITPGCLGAFTVVSLYTHRMMGFAGLVTVMIATSGDEAFVMFALFPGKAMLLHLILLLVAVAAGFLVHLFTKKKQAVAAHGFVFHEHENCTCFVKSEIIPQLKKISFERIMLVLVTVTFIFLLLIGAIGSSDWGWKKILFFVSSLFLLFVFLTVPEHFLKEHLYKHIIKKHLLRIFGWTWGAFIILHLVQSNLELSNLLQNNSYWVLLVAVLVGLIPESGPHLLFATLFSQNLLPFSILIANSIVQDGHGMLPLLAESGKDFLKVKIINLAVGIVIGFILLKIGI